MYKVPEKYLNTSLMTDRERRFLNGLIRAAKPKNILEIGVHFGGGSCIILNAISDDADANLVSVDIGGDWCGSVAREFSPDNKQWQMFKEKDAVEVLDLLNIKFDFMVLDTTHCLSGEVLHFLAAFPFLENGAIVALHDISLYTDFNCHFEQSCGLLYSTVVANKKTAFVKDFNKEYMLYPNIAAFQITGDTGKYIENLFHVLRLPWQYQIGEWYEEIYLSFTNRHYGEECRQMLADAIRINNSKSVSLGAYASNVIMRGSAVCSVEQSINFISEYRSYAEKRKAVFYGGSVQITKRCIWLMQKHGLPMPNYIWDINAIQIGALEGQTVTEPDWDMLNNDNDYMAILFLTSNKNVSEVRNQFEEKGVAKIIRYEDFVMHLTTHIKNDIYQKY